LSRKNVTASVTARLKSKAKEAGVAFQAELTHYGLERFLYRLSVSPQADIFVLKGGLMLKVWGAAMTRPTKDIDFLAYTDNSVANIEKLLREICELPVEDDGLRFDTSTLKAIEIKEDADYTGVRVTFMGFLGRMKIPMQVDVGFNDVITPGAQEGLYPGSLNLPPAVLKMYPAQTTIAEKLQAMVYLGDINSRMKDFFDIFPDTGGIVHRVTATASARTDRRNLLKLAYRGLVESAEASMAVPAPAR